MANVKELGPLKASVKVEQDATSDGEENVDEMDLKEEDDIKSETKRELEDWDFEYFDTTHVAEEETEERVWQGCNSIDIFDGLNLRLIPRLNCRPIRPLPKLVLNPCLKLRLNSSLKIQMSIELHPRRGGRGPT